MVEANLGRGYREPVTAREILDDIRRRVPGNIGVEPALTEVMCSFTQHLSRGEVRDVVAALPEQLHPLLEPCTENRPEHAERFDREQLVLRVADHLTVARGQAEEIISAVLLAISSHLPRKEVYDVASQLPRDLRELWAVGLSAAEPHPMFVEIEESVSLPAGITGADALANVMCSLSERLALADARRLFGALPRDLRPLLDDCLARRAEEAAHFDYRSLLARVASDLGIDDADALVRGVFRAVQRYMPKEAIDRVRPEFPPELLDVWDAP